MKAFWRHPSPWLIGTLLVCAATARGLADAVHATGAAILDAPSNRIDGFLAAITIAEASDFLCNKMDGWSLDWLLKPANFTKVREGNYSGRGEAAGTQQPRAGWAAGMP